MKSGRLQYRIGGLGGGLMQTHVSVLGERDGARKSFLLSPVPDPEFGPCVRYLCGISWSSHSGQLEAAHGMEEGGKFHELLVSYPSRKAVRRSLIHPQGCCLAHSVGSVT